MVVSGSRAEVKKLHNHLKGSRGKVPRSIGSSLSTALEVQVLIKVLSHPGHGKCYIVGNWTCFSISTGQHSDAHLHLKRKNIIPLRTGTGTAVFERRGGLRRY